MTELSELSRLPDDEEYWKRLEARVLDGLGGEVPAHAAPAAEWWAPLASRAYALGAVALVATVAALVLVPSRSSAPTAPGSGILRPPADDPGLVALLSAPEPPSIGALVLPTDRRDP